MHFTKLLLMLGTVFASFSIYPALTQQTSGRVVRIAELEIDPAQLANYAAAVKKEMEVSVGVEPGVLAIYAVSIKGSPTHLRFFEIYADQNAYEAHRESPHFKSYVETTKDMILSRKLIETDIFHLSEKSN
jgi:quinol monooxygenase YgiN